MTRTRSPGADMPLVTRTVREKRRRTAYGPLGWGAIELAARQRAEEGRRPSDRGPRERLGPW